jgi:uncharacterized membrane protein
MDKLITVFESHDVLEAEMVRMVLQEQDIPSEIENAHQAGFSGVLAAKVYVKADDADRAREIVSELDRVDSEPYRLVVMAFDNESTADEVQLAMRKLERSYLVDLKDSVVIIKHLNGEIALKQTYHLTRAGAVAGGVLGTLVGALFMNPGLGLVAGAAAGAVTGALGDIGINDEFLQEVGDSLRNASSALAILVRRADPEKVLAELGKFEGTVVQTTLSHADEERLRDALAAGESSSE